MIIQLRIKWKLFKRKIINYKINMCRKWMKQDYYNMPMYLREQSLLENLINSRKILNLEIKWLRQQLRK